MKACEEMCAARFLVSGLVSGRLAGLHDGSLDTTSRSVSLSVSHDPHRLVGLEARRIFENRAHTWYVEYLSQPVLDGGEAESWRAELAEHVQFYLGSQQCPHNFVHQLASVCPNGGTLLRQVGPLSFSPTRCASRYGDFGFTPGLAEDEGLDMVRQCQSFLCLSVYISKARSLLRVSAPAAIHSPRLFSNSQQ